MTEKTIRGETVAYGPASGAFEEAGDPRADKRAFRRCLGQFGTGVTVMTADHGGRRVGVTVNSFSSLSLDPPLVLWSIARTSRSFDAFVAAPHFAINILAADQVSLSQKFSGAEDDKFVGVNWQTGEWGAPLLEGVVGTLECRLHAAHDGGDHVLLIGEVLRYARFRGEALLFAQGRYAIAREHPARTERRDDAVSAGDGAAGESLPLSTLFLKAYFSHVEAFARIRDSVGLSALENRLIFTLSENPGLSQGQLASRAYMSELATGDTLAELRMAGLAEKSAEEVWHLTEAGRVLKRRMRQLTLEFEQEVLAGVGEDELHRVRDFASAYVARTTAHAR